jgi:predicted ATPase with chaperone activity
MLQNPSELEGFVFCYMISLMCYIQISLFKVSRTIADLEGVASINGSHISEAIQYRSMDRDDWFGGVFIII